MDESRYGEDIAEVTGLKDKINFKLKEKEIKHIRRCLNMYDMVHARDYPNAKSNDDLTRKIHKMFSEFGRLKNPLSQERKKSVVKELIKKDGARCSFKGCEEKDNLTIAHQRPLASGVNNNETENLKFLCPKHHLLFDLKSMLWKKGLEMEKLKKRIEDIELRGTTDTLGMGVLSKDKFENLDE